MSITIRDLSGMTEFEAAEQLQIDVWGEDDRPDPADLMMVIAHEGGLVAGAFEDKALIGYIFGFPTREPNIQHSHRLAVRPQARGGGLAAKLKWYQRDWCLKRGINQVRWTYDPLRATNANLNINRLGCTADTYFVDYYGAMAGINQGAPSDRLQAEWDLISDRVDALATGKAVEMDQVAMQIAIPGDFGKLLASDQAFAISERLRVRELMTDAFAKGLRVVGFDPNSKSYLLR